MKKLGKKKHEIVETIEAYECPCKKSHCGCTTHRAFYGLNDNIYNTTNAYNNKR